MDLGRCRQGYGRALLSLLVLQSLAFHTTNAAYCFPTSGVCWPTRTVFTTWSSSLTDHSDVILPDKSGDLFLSEAASMNSLKSNFPGLIVIPGTEGDLRSALKFAANHRIRVIVRCSGGDMNGRSTGRGGMLIKMQRLSGVGYVNATQTVIFGAGATHADIFRTLSPLRRLFVGANSNVICPSGCLAGGCHGVLSRQYGLGIDNIIEFRIMLFNGTVLIASRTLNSDLFNAYLGAGQNSFGVALSFKARTYPAPERIYVIDAVFSVINPNAPEPDNLWPNLLTTFFLNITWFHSMPLELAGSIHIDGDAVSIRFFYTGPDFTAAQRVLQPLLQSSYAAHVYPVATYTDMYDSTVAAKAPVSDIWARKFAVNGFLPEDPWVMDNVATLVIEQRPVMWLSFMFGGAVAQGTTGSVPVGMRTAMYEMVVSTVWFDPADDQERMQYVMSFAPELYGMAESSYSDEFTTWGNSYVVGDWKTRFFSDFEGLVAVKQKYDPCNLFTVRYGVGSDVPTATCGLVVKV